MTSVIEMDKAYKEGQRDAYETVKREHPFQNLHQNCVLCTWLDGKIAGTKRKVPDAIA